MLITDGHASRHAVVLGRNALVSYGCCNACESQVTAVWQPATHAAKLRFVLGMVQ